jgi:hypothetical protein
MTTKVEEPAIKASDVKEGGTYTEVITLGGPPRLAPTVPQ